MHDRRNTRLATERGFGGFPYPQTLIWRFMKRFFPSAHQRMKRTLTMPRTRTIASGVVDELRHPVKTVSYLSFSAIVGRNSKFHMLSEDELEELGGIEYRALTALLWLVAGVSTFLSKLF